MDLLSLTYSSRAATVLDDGDLEEILRASRNNNALDGLSGFLLFNGDAFLQVLEGTRPAVEDVMLRIRKDPRHTDVTVVDEGPLAERAFPDWSMGFLRISGDLSDASAIDRALAREATGPTRERLVAMAASMRDRG